MHDCTLTDNASSFGLFKSHTKFIVSKVNTQRLSGHPVKFSESELYEIVSRIF